MEFFEKLMCKDKDLPQKKKFNNFVSLANFAD
jgi:hypothetical protein